MGDFELKTKFEGSRFEDTSLPFEQWDDLVTFRKIIVKLAIILWREDYPTRTNKPDHFTNFDWKVRFSEGSCRSAVVAEKVEIGNIDTEIGTQATTVKTHYPYFEKAISVVPEIIASINDGEDFPYNDFELLKEFKKLGSKLRSGERIQLEEDRVDNVYFTLDTRKKVREIEMKIDVEVDKVLVGPVYEIDTSKNTFHICSGNRNMKGVYPAIFEKILLAEVGKGSILEINATFLGKKMLRINNAIKRTSLVDQFKEILELDDGWYDGEGLAPSELQINWLKVHFGNQLNFPLPRIYPTLDGGVKFEWMFGRKDVSLEFLRRNKFDPDLQDVEWYVLDLSTDIDQHKTLNYSDNSSWILDSLVGLNK